MTKSTHNHFLASIISLLFVVVSLINPSASHAAVINYNGVNSNAHGTGFGNATNLLVVHRTGNPKDGKEYGSVLWNGSAVVTTDDATNQSEAPTVAQLNTLGVDADNFAVIFNLSQAGSTALDLHDFSLVFQTSAGATLFTAAFDHEDPANVSTLGLNADSHGTGKGGYVFPVSFTPAEAALFFSSSTNRVGMVISAADAISNEANGGAESFYVSKTVVPEPSSLSLLIAGAFGLLRRPR